jgi:tetratricopeptide (TPR) repeat protein
MVTEKKKVIKAHPKPKQVVQKPKRKIDWKPIVIIVFCFVLYGNTIPNHYSMDDELITHSNQRVIEGIKSIPGIWTSLYSEGKLKYEYRPVVKTVFAIEQQIFGANPHVGHFINILIYIFTCLLLFKLLKKLLKDFNPIFPFVTILLFIAHPIHTEVIASLKNRDEMLSFLGCLISLHFLLKYSEASKWEYIAFAFFFYLLAYLSKSSAIVFLAIFPLVLYFFTNASPKKLLLVFAVILVALIAARYVPKLYLPKPEREVFYFENPLFFHPGFMIRLGTGMITLLFYLKILIFPHPLLFYYGYNVIPMVSLTDGWAIFSLLLHLGLFVYAILKLKQKHILSFIILFYLICISMFSNLIKPAMGIVGERYVYASSVAFCLALAYFIFLILKNNPRAKSFSQKELTWIFILLLIILVPYSVKTIIRNKNWDTHLSLYSHDIEYLENSAKANALLAGQLNTELNEILFKGIRPAYLKSRVDSIIFIYKRCLDVYPEYYSSYNNIGSVYFTIMKDYATAIPYFEKAISMHPDYVEASFNIAFSYEMLGRIKKDSSLDKAANYCFISAIKYYDKAIKLKPDYIRAMSNLANLYFNILGNTDSALAINKRIMRINPNTDMPYVNLGNYSLIKGDTISAVQYMEKSVELVPQNYETCMRLSHYFNNKHDLQKADKYMQMAQKAKKEISGMNKGN